MSLGDGELPLKHMKFLKLFTFCPKEIWSCFMSMFTFFVVDSDAAGLELEDGVRRNW